MARREEVKVQTGDGWQELARAVREEIPETEVDGVWTFQSVRQDTREWGTAIVSRMDGERRRIYTARYVHTIKGRERGAFTSTIQEVGSGPVESVEELIRGVEKRADNEMPEPVVVSDWFPPADDGESDTG